MSVSHENSTAKLEAVMQLPQLKLVEKRKKERRVETDKQADTKRETEKEKDTQTDRD